MTHITQPKTLKIVTLISLSLIIFSLAAPLLAQAQNGGVGVHRCADPNTEDGRNELKKACRNRAFPDDPRAQPSCNIRCFFECGAVEGTNDNVCDGSPGSPMGRRKGVATDSDWEVDGIVKKCILCTYSDGDCTPARCNERKPQPRQQSSFDQEQPRFFIEDDRGNLISQSQEELLEKGIFLPTVPGAPTEEEPGFFEKTFNVAKDAFSAVLDFFGLKLGKDVRLPVTFIDGLAQSENAATVNENILGASQRQIEQTIATLKEAQKDLTKAPIALSRAEETVNAVRDTSREIANYAANTENDLNNELANLTAAGYGQDETDEALRNVGKIINELRNMRRIANEAYEKATNLDSLTTADAMMIPQYLAALRDMGLSVDGLFELNSNLQKDLAEKTKKQKVLADKDREEAQKASGAIAQSLDRARQTTNNALNDGTINKNEQKALDKIANDLNKVSDTLIKATRGTDGRTQANAQGLVSASENTSSTLKGLSRQKDVSSEAATAALAVINNSQKIALERKSDLEKSTKIAKGIELLMSLIMEAARTIRPEAEIGQSLNGDSAKITSALTGGMLLGYAVNTTEESARMPLEIIFLDLNESLVARGQIETAIDSNTISPIYAQAPTEDQRALTAAVQRLANGSYTISSETKNGQEGVGLVRELPKPLSSHNQSEIKKTIENVVNGLSMARNMAQQRMERAADLAEQLFGELASFFEGGGHLNENGVANLPSGKVQTLALHDSEDVESYAFTTGSVDKANLLTIGQKQNFENQFDCGGRDGASVSGSVFSCNENARTGITNVTSVDYDGDILVSIGKPGLDYNSDHQYFYGMNVDNPCAQGAGGAILQNYQLLSNPFAFLAPRALAYSIAGPGYGGGGGGYQTKIVDGIEYVFFEGKWHKAVRINGKLLAQVYTGPNQTIMWPKVGSPPPPPPPPVGGPMPVVAQPKAGMIAKAFSKAVKAFIKGAGETLAVATGVAILGQGCASEDTESAGEHSERILQDIADYADEQSQQGNDIEAAAAGIIGTALDALNSIGGGVAVSGLSNLWDLISGGD